jgi:hypothetical protein
MDTSVLSFGMTSIPNVAGGQEGRRRDAIANSTIHHCTNSGIEVNPHVWHVGLLCLPREDASAGGGLDFSGHEDVDHFIRSPRGDVKPQQWLHRASDIAALLEQLASGALGRFFIRLVQQTPRNLPQKVGHRVAVLTYKKNPTVLIECHNSRCTRMPHDISVDHMSVDIDTVCLDRNHSSAELPSSGQERMLKRHIPKIREIATRR